MDLESSKARATNVLNRQEDEQLSIEHQEQELSTVSFPIFPRLLNRAVHWVTARPLKLMDLNIAYLISAICSAAQWAGTLGHSCP